MKQRNIPVIDIFAGPGGLGEGFSSLHDSRGSQPFEIAISIEKDAFAHKTLLLRTFLREFPEKEFPGAYYQFVREANDTKNNKLDRLLEKFPLQSAIAKQKALLAELGVTERNIINTAINNAVKGKGESILIGGPPCQAYSIAGRSRNKGIKDYVPKDDNRQFLYIEYLHIIAEHSPAVFVMENVKGLLSATVNEQRMFDRILEDLRDPFRALSREGRKSITKNNKQNHPRYRIRSLVAPVDSDSDKTSDYVVRMEKYDVPQSRHRIILIGIREDLGAVEPELLKECETVTANQVLDGMPRLRSGLSRESDSDDAWLKALKSSETKRWVTSSSSKAGEDVHTLLTATLNNLSAPRAGRGGEFISYESRVGYRPNWYLDKRLDGVCNHSSRSHMTTDLYRYLYASCFAMKQRRSPRLCDFPADLLPDHENTPKALNGSGNFSDRFRVQLGGVPSTTITSHISKDGHYYIHPDPTQCRSLTVREAARLQTFPDNYFFYGPRTEQYIQVGNAVPPLLARQIAKIVLGVLERSGVA